MEVTTFSCIPRASDTRGEDRIYASDDFIAVVDGATPKVDNDGGGGEVVAEAVDRIVASIATLPATATARSAVDMMSSAIADLGIDGPARPSAAVIILSNARSEVWIIGTGAVRIDDDVHYFTTAHEEAAARTRSVYLTQLLRTRATAVDLQGGDAGRELILPVLRAEYLLRNVDDDGLWYFGSVDGTPVPDRFIDVLAVPKGAKTVILASDGYPVVESDFDGSERYLKTLMANDPLMITAHPQTKGLGVGAVGYDDRSFIQIAMGHR